MTRPLATFALTALILVGGCTSEEAGRDPLDFPLDGEDGKEDVFGRALAGIAAPYEPDLGLAAEEGRLNGEMGFRRETAWRIVGRTLDPVPLLGLAERSEAGQPVVLPDGEVPNVPRFQTWYGIEDVKRMFQYLYENLGPDGRIARAPFDEGDLAEVFEWNAAALERSNRWPLERFLDYVEQLGVCPEGTPADECARLRQSNFSGATAGNARITYSPGTVMHILRSYPRVLRCLDELGSLAMDREPDPANFSFCYESEMPPDAVLIKAQWVRSDFGMELGSWDTDAAGIARQLSPDTSGDWATGDRQVSPGPERIHTIRLRNGNTYRLAGLHIMTKETRHWIWITLFWSESPDTDFGADRPSFIRERLDPVFSNYKMCVVTAYDEGDPDVARWFSDTPSLAEALTASRGGATGAGGPTWCSNPYVEHGRGNSRTNCIGCHQHGGSAVGLDTNGDGTLDPFDLDAVIADPEHFPFNGRTQLRQVFPADYLWSTSRVDDIAGMIRSEVMHFDTIDEDSVPRRAAAIAAMMGDPAVGAATFAANCTRCHGTDGRGTTRAPSLYERVPMREDLSILTTLIAGRSAMPAWGATFDDATLAGLLAHLRRTFDAPAEPRSPARAGDVIITEIMYDPQATADAYGEWLELHNPTASPMTLDACTMHDDHTSASLAGMVIPPNGYVTIARSAAGFTPTATFALQLDNAGGDVLSMRCGDTVIDAVDYRSGFPRASGASLSLDPSAVDPLANDAGASWCLGRTAYGSGDLGTPNAPNPDC